MPNKGKRIGLTVPPDLEALLMQESTARHIPPTTLALLHLYEHYEGLQKQVGWVKQSREEAPRRPPVFEFPEAEPIPQSEAARKSVNRQKS